MNDTWKEGQKVKGMMNGNRDFLARLLVLDGLVIVAIRFSQFFSTSPLIALDGNCRKLKSCLAKTAILWR